MMASRAEKEAFVTGHLGTTKWEILLISVVFIAGWVLYAMGACLVRLQEGSAASWAVGILTMLCPALLACWFPQAASASKGDGIYQLNILLLMIGFAVILLVATKQRQKPTVSLGEAQSAQDAHPKACVTLFRAGITAYTCIAILAVDFPYFPRRLAKAETFGTGLMDIGPGVFVFSSGLGLGLRLHRLKAQFQRACGSEQASKACQQQSSTLSLLLRAMKSIGPLLLLGLARMVLTKAVDYQEHHSEYGVHWNFFFTLACVACMGAFAPLSGGCAAAAALAAGALHQMHLSQPGVSEWLGAHQRDMSSLLDANKEGLVSTGGYVAIFYAGSAFALLLQPIAGDLAQTPSQSARPVLSSSGPPNQPTDSQKQQTVGGGDSFSNTSTETFASAAYRGVSEAGEQMSSNGVECIRTQRGGAAQRGFMWWHAKLWILAAVVWLLAAQCDALVQPVSRRFCNAAYVLWVAAMAITQAALAALVNLIVAVATGVPRPRCVVAEGLSENQLVVFLLANVLTGMVNLCMDTLGAGPVLATCTMVLYCTAWGCTGLFVKGVKQVVFNKTRKD